MMTATWYLVRYMPDMQRREPRNVGLVLKTPDGWFTRFVGEKENGEIDGKSIQPYRLKKEVYTTWVEYFRRKAHDDDTWSDVWRAQARRTLNYFAEIGGEIVDREDSWHVLIDELFAELVQIEPPKPKGESAADVLIGRIDHILDAADVSPQRKVTVEAKFGDLEDEVPFLYSYVNGQRHLMDVVSTHKRPDIAAHDARELRTRVEAARAAGVADSFIAFYDESLFEAGQVDRILRPVEELSETVNVADENQAVDKIRSMMRH